MVVVVVVGMIGAQEDSRTEYEVEQHTVGTNGEGEEEEAYMMWVDTHSNGAKVFAFFFSLWN